MSETKTTIASVTIELFSDGSTSIIIPDEFQDKIGLNQLEEILRQTLDKVYVNRISLAVTKLMEENSAPSKNN
jgi:hypothetical protein